MCSPTAVGYLNVIFISPLRFHGLGTVATWQPHYLRRYGVTHGSVIIVLHIRPSPGLMVSQLQGTSGCHALCSSISKVVVIAVTSRVAQLLCSLTLAIPGRALRDAIVVEEAGVEPAPMPSCASMYLCYLLHHSPKCGAVQPSKSLDRRLSPLISSSPRLV